MGDSTYDAPFSYPPTSAAFFVPLALLNYSYAKTVWLLLNLLSVAAIAVMTVYTINQRVKESGNKIGSGLIAAFIIGNPLTTNVVWEGQTTLITFASVMAAYFFSRHNILILAGICLGVSTIKPQISLLVFVWFALERSWKILAVASGTAGLMSIYLIFLQGPVSMLLAWYERLKTHEDFYTNMPGTEFVIGLQSLLIAAGFPVPSLGIIGVALVALLWLFRKRVNQNDVFAILMGLTLLFIFNLDSAYICSIPIITSLWLYSYNNRVKLTRLIILVILFIFPRRIVRILGIPVLYHWRTVVILILLSALVVLSFKYQSKLNTCE